MTHDIYYEIASTEIFGVGDKMVRVLVSYCGSAQAIFDANRSKLSKVPGIGPKTIESIIKGDALKKAEGIMKQCERLAIEPIYFTNSDYPQYLKQWEDAPPILYVKGVSNLNFSKSVAIVGTRNATEYGKNTTENIVEDLVPHQACIVSGLAYGIDITAHRAALNQNLSTVAVLAGGIDWIYPAQHKKTAEEICENGALISENPPRTKPEAHLFPARNRIIAGMSDATVVVEAAEKGGALITAEIAFSYEKPVFAVPGNVGNKYSEGCNKLIRDQKAYILSDINSLEYNLGWTKEHEKAKKEPVDISMFEHPEQSVLELLMKCEDGMQIDEIAWKTQNNVNHLASLLLGLEFKGIVKSLPGKRYCIRT